MEMRKCMNGHYYDASVNSNCPYCSSGASTGNTASTGAPKEADAGKTVALPPRGSGSTVPSGDSRTAPVGYNPSLSGPYSSADDDDGRTIAVVHREMGIDPVVGWLVNVNGKEKGRDYRIHSDNNYIGRSERMDICVRGDETISRENHATVSYDSVDKIYYFSPGEGRNIVRHNGKAIFQTVEIGAYDKITVGKTELIFIPLCGKQFEWSEDDVF